MNNGDNDRQARFLTAALLCVLYIVCLFLCWRWFA